MSLALPSRRVVSLANGARLVVDPMPHLRSASVGVWIGAGARHEPEDQAGLAHFLEHMAFKGADGRNAREIAEAVEQVGATMNAATEHERTSFFVRCLAEDAPRMLEIALSLVFGPTHPAEDLPREKSVVAQEIGEAADQPDDLVFELAQAAAFPGHPLGRPILGTEASLAGIVRDDLFGFAQTAYTPDRIVVSLAGGAELDAVLPVAERWLSSRRAAAQPPGRAPTTGETAVRAEVRKLEQAHIVLSRPGPSAVSDNRFAARLFAEIFGGGMASRLFQEVREEKGLAYIIDAFAEQYSDAGRLTVYAGCAARDVGELVRLTQAIWGELADKGPTGAELARAKALMRAGMAMGLEGPAGRASSSAYELLTFGRLMNLDDVMAQIEAVTANDVRTIARDSLSGPGIAALVGPATGARQLEKAWAAA
jgi:predicted Zn-dependent peptidase